MMARILTAYQVELIKAIRTKFTYVGPVLVVIMVLVAPLMSAAAPGGSSYQLIAFATPMALNLLGLLLTLTFCASLIASEMAAGTVRLLLVRPLLRHEFLIAKLLTGMTYAVLLSVLVASTTWAIGFARGGLHGVEYGGEVLYTSAEMFAAYGIGWVLSLAPQFAFVAYAIMISTLIRNTGAAVGASIGIWLVTDVIKYPLGIAPAIFTTYVETPWSVFQTRCSGLDASWFPMAYYCLATSLAAIVVFAGIAGYSLQRRNLQA
jgi:ABC-2 type transport system permease protein